MDIGYQEVDETLVEEPGVDLEIAQDLADRLTSIFLRADDGHRPVFGGTARFQSDPAWDNLLFFEYFHGDNGAGLGASHQTGWTALVLDLLLDPPAGGRSADFAELLVAGDA